MEPLVFDTSAIFNFGHRGELETLLANLATQHRLVTTPFVQDECSKGPHKRFYDSFVSIHFEILEAETIAIPRQALEQLHASIDMGEISVMLLAADLKGIAVIDDKLARTESTRLGIRIMGTLGLIEKSMRAGWLTDDDCLEIVRRLRAGKFSIPKPGANDTFTDYLRALTSGR